MSQYNLHVLFLFAIGRYRIFRFRKTEDEDMKLME